MEESKQTVESVKKLLDKLREEFKHNKLPVKDFLLSSVRDGTNDYDFKNSITIRDDDYWVIKEIKSYIDGKKYVGKIYGLDYIPNELKFEREINAMLSLKHQFIIQIVDVFKSKWGDLWIIVEKFD